MFNCCSVSVGPAAGRCAALLLFMLLQLNAAVPSQAVKYMVPAYWTPNCANGKLAGPWKQLTQVDNPKSLTVIVNAANGPLYPSYDANGNLIPDPLVACLAPLVKAKITILGYVYSGYGTRDLSTVLADVNRWKAAYPGLSGIFVDETAGWKYTNPTILNYYSSLASGIRAAGLPIVSVNPGARLDPTMLGVMDIIVAYEGPAAGWTVGENQGVCPPPAFVTAPGTPGYCNATVPATKRAKSTPLYCSYITPGSCSPQGTSQFAMLSYCTTAGKQWQQIADQAQDAGYTYLYLTQLGCNGTNPWSALPSYWGNESDLRRRSSLRRALA